MPRKRYSSKRIQKQTQKQSKRHSSKQHQKSDVVQRNEEPICAFCLQNFTSNNPGKRYCPCRLLHEECLLTYVNTMQHISGIRRCEVCLTPYQFCDEIKCRCNNCCSPNCKIFFKKHITLKNVATWFFYTLTYNLLMFGIRGYQDIIQKHNLTDMVMSFLIVITMIFQISSTFTHIIISNKFRYKILLVFLINSFIITIFHLIGFYLLNHHYDFVISTFTNRNNYPNYDFNNKFTDIGLVTSTLGFFIFFLIFVIVVVILVILFMIILKLIILVNIIKNCMFRRTIMEIPI